MGTALVGVSVCFLLIVLFTGSLCLVVPSYVGCFKDSESQRALSGYQNIHDGLKVESCNSLCFSKGYKYAGSENGNECYCGEYDAKVANVADESECNKPCSGNSGQICGGQFRLSVYSTGFQDIPAGELEIGCLSDLGEKRLLSKYKIDLPRTNSPSRCISICHSLGFKQAGVQYSYECHCGRTEKRSPLEDGCDYKCPGDSAYFCGGESKMNVYNTGARELITPTIDYLGCFRNKPGGLLDGSKTIIEKMDPLKCISHCYSLGFILSGIYNKTECQCGGLPNPVPKEDSDTSCSLICPGSASYTCGGKTHVSGYSTGIIGDKVMGKSIGCFRDENNSILKGIVLNLEGRNSPENCILQCIKLRFAYAGTKDTSQCKCGNSLQQKETVPDNLCNLACSEDNTRTCGGTGLIQVYRTGLDHFIESTDKKCLESKSETKGKKACSEERLFTEHFVSIDSNIWKKTVRISGEDDEFVTYTSEEKNIFVKDGKLVIKPIILEDMFVRIGALKLEGCTGNRNTQQCEQTAKSFWILPPVESAQICTDNSFNFKYGTVTVRAKLPSGDWVVPQIWLKPVKEKYGSSYKSGKILLATSFGNSDLKGPSGEDLSSRLLESGIMLANSSDPVLLKKKTVSVSAQEPWHSQFHNYTFVWTPDEMSFYYDEKLNTKQIIYNKEMGSVAQAVGFTDKDNIWKTGPSTAPFDEQFYICLGLSVGGHRSFKDGSLSHGVPKQWKNSEVKALLKFWQARSNWTTSWSENTKMEVDFVSVTAL